MTASSAPRIGLSGSSGLVGSALRARLEGSGCDVAPLVRRSPQPGEIEWRPEDGLTDPASAEGLAAVVHLAGESLASGRWSERRKERFRSSRVQATAQLVRCLSSLEAPPQRFLCASAIGFYGDRGDEWLDESSAPGTGFLADLCREWEAAAVSARAADTTTILRFGVVLAARGGALERMAMPARLGLGGPLGSGRQHFSWITLDDVVSSIVDLLDGPAHSGPVNLVAPTDDTNATFTRALGQVLRRPTIFRAPAFALRAALGEMAEEMLLASQRVRPGVLEQRSVSFSHPDAQTALAALLR